MKSEFLDAECTILKFVCLIEQEPLSDKFEQIMLTPAQFKELSQWFWDLKLQAGSDKGEQGFSTSDRFKNIYIPDIPQMYTEDDLENPLK